jgi:hypothetical protein
MPLKKRGFRVKLDTFHHLYSTKMGHIYAPFLLKQVGIKVKGKITDLPTIIFHQNPFDSESHQFDKKIVDKLYLLLTKAKGESAYQLTAFQAEHQNRNQARLIYRMFDYYNSLTQEFKDKDVIIEQVLVYTGEEEFKSPTTLKRRKNKYSYSVVDLTKIDPSELFKEKDFAIHFLCIFNKNIPEPEKIRIIVDGLKTYIREFGREEAQFFMDVIYLTMNKDNTRTSTIDAILTAMSMDDELDELIKQSKFYSKVQKDSKVEGIEIGKVEGIEIGKVLTAAEIIRSGISSLEALTETLRLTPAEIAAIQAQLQQSSSNGNGSNGNHQK